MASTYSEVSTTDLMTILANNNIHLGKNPSRYSVLNAFVQLLSEGAGAIPNASTNNKPSKRQQMSDMDAAEINAYKKQLEKKVEELVSIKVEAAINEALNPKPNTSAIEFKHELLDEVLQLAQLRAPIYLVGPSGCGKTHLAKQLAQALNLNLTQNSMSEGATESQIFGKVVPDSNGVWSYQPSPFVYSFQNGGVHLFDEIDGADSNLLVSINSAISNGWLSIPIAGVEPIQMHDDFICIAAANTYGLGADAVYVGRNRLDGATLDRYATSTFYMDYDKKLEKKLAQDICKQHADAILKWCHDIRDKIDANKLQRIMSMRTVIWTAKQCAAGIQMEKVQKRFFSSWSDADKQLVGWTN